MFANKKANEVSRYNNSILCINRLDAQMNENDIAIALFNALTNLQMSNSETNRIPPWFSNADYESFWRSEYIQVLDQIVTAYKEKQSWLQPSRSPYTAKFRERVSKLAFDIELGINETCTSVYTAEPMIVLEKMESLVANLSLLNQLYFTSGELAEIPTHPSTQVTFPIILGVVIVFALLALVSAQKRGNSHSYNIGPWRMSRHNVIN